MPIVFTSQGVGQPLIIEDLLNKYGPALTGRWAKAPAIPDRCDFCPWGDIKPAIGFITEGDWRRGFCATHRIVEEERNWQD